MDKELARRRDISFRVPGRICVGDGLMLLGAVPVAGGVSALSVQRSPHMTP